MITLMGSHMATTKDLQRGGRTPPCECLLCLRLRGRLRVAIHRQVATRPATAEGACP